METPNVVTDAEIFAEYRANPTIENRNKLVERYQHDCRRLAGATFRRFRGDSHSIQRDEFVLDCNIVLIKSIEAYDPTKFTLPFIPFLTVNIRRKLLNVSERESNKGNGKPVFSLDKEYNDYDAGGFDPVDYRSNEYDRVEVSDLLKFAKSILGESFVQQLFVDGRTIKDVAADLGVCRTVVKNRVESFARLYRKRSKIDVA